jgi:hypothetical protein
MTEEPCALCLQRPAEGAARCRDCEDRLDAWTEGLREHEPRGRQAVPRCGMSLRPRPSQGRRAPPARAGRVSGRAGRRPRAVPEVRASEEMAAGSDCDRTGYSTYRNVEVAALCERGSGP